MYSPRFSLSNSWRTANERFTRVSASLVGAPQSKGLVLKLAIITPNNPNSALRHVANMTVYNTARHAFARLPGIGSLPSNYNSVLARGGSANDLPTVRLTLIRGVYDFAGLFGNNNSSSIYGTARLEGAINHVRRRYSHLKG